MHEYVSHSFLLSTWHHYEYHHNHYSIIIIFSSGKRHKINTACVIISVCHNVSKAWYWDLFMWSEKLLKSSNTLVLFVVWHRCYLHIANIRSARSSSFLLLCRGGHMDHEQWTCNASREKILSMVIFFIFVHKNVYRIRFQEIKIRSLGDFEFWVLRALFLTFPHEKTTFQWSKVVSEAIFLTN